MINVDNISVNIVIKHINVQRVMLSSNTQHSKFLSGSSVKIHTHNAVIILNMTI